MSDMSHLYKAYAAVHDPEVKESLSQIRDEISEMTLTKLTDTDLYEIAEEVLEEVFAQSSDVIAAEKLIESIFVQASKGDSSPGRIDKLERLGEAFKSAFGRVKEKSIRVAVESYSEYRQAKERRETMSDLSGLDRSNVKLHNSLVAEDREVVKRGLRTMIEATYGNPAAKEEKLRKDDKLFGSPKKYTVTNADKTGNTPAWKNYKAGDKRYTAAAHLKKEELETTGIFSEEEIKKILWTEFEEGYQRNPEEGERKERADAKKREAIPGQASRGMPPRGDKKREEFEKWYAANVR